MLQPAEAEELATVAFVGEGHRLNAIEPTTKKMAANQKKRSPQTE
jgi:hypothetical protein